jgi:hypothetical protein
LEKKPRPFSCPSWNKGDASVSFGDHRSPPYEPVEAVFIVDSAEECDAVKAVVKQIKGSV